MEKIVKLFNIALNQEHYRILKRFFIITNFKGDEITKFGEIFKIYK